MIKFGKLKITICSQEAKYNRTDLPQNTTINKATLHTYLDNIFKYCRRRIRILDSTLAYTKPLLMSWPHNKKQLLWSGHHRFKILSYVSIKRGKKRKETMSKYTTFFLIYGKLSSIFGIQRRRTCSSHMNIKFYNKF